MAIAAAPANTIGVMGLILTVMISVYHQNGERDRSIVGMLLPRLPVTYSVVGLHVCQRHPTERHP